MCETCSFHSRPPCCQKRGSICIFGGKKGVLARGLQRLKASPVRKCPQKGRGVGHLRGKQRPGHGADSKEQRCQPEGVAGEVGKWLARGRQRSRGRDWEGVGLCRRDRCVAEGGGEGHRTGRAGWLGCATLPWWGCSGASLRNLIWTPPLRGVYY